MNERIGVLETGFRWKREDCLGGWVTEPGIEDGNGKLIFCAVACCDPRLNIEQIFGIGTGMSSTSDLILFPL